MIRLSIVKPRQTGSRKKTLLPEYRYVAEKTSDWPYISSRENYSGPRTKVYMDASFFTAEFAEGAEVGRKKPEQDFIVSASSAISAVKKHLVVKRFNQGRGR